jgi:PAS domain S-box-containing protein
MRFWRYIILLVLIVLIHNSAQSQRYVIHNYTEENGLPNSQVFDIVQDNDGYLYFSTRNKIARYDGYSFLNYSLQEHFTHYGYNRLVIDKNNRIWAYSNFSSLGVYFFENNIWRKLPTPVCYTTSTKVLGNDFGIIYKDRYDYQLAFSFRYTGVGYVANGELTFFDRNSNLQDTIVNDIQVINDKFWVCTRNGISIIQGDTIDNSINNFYDFPDKNILAVAQDDIDSSKIWILGKTFIGYISNKKLSILVDDLDNFYDWSVRNYTIIPNYFSGVVFSDGLKIFICDKITKKITEISKDNDLIDNRPYGMCLDREGNLWASFSRGISKISSLRFTTFTDLDGLLESEVSAISQDNDGNMILGHNFGITFFKDSVIKTTEFDSKGYVDVRILEFLEDKIGRKLFSANRLGIGEVRNLSSNWVKFPKMENDFIILSLDTAKNLLLKNKDKLYKQLPGGAITEIISDTNIQLIRRMSVDKNDDIYFLSVDRGLIKLEDSTLKFYKGHNRESNSIYSMVFDFQGVDLVGTLGGLYYLDRKKDSLIKYSKNRFVLNSPCYFIIRDIHNENKIWIGTDAGVVTWDGVNNVRYGVKDGLAGLECNRGAAYFDEDGNFWVGTNAGVSKYNGNYEFDFNIKPLIHLDSIVGGQVAFDPNKRIELEHDQNTLSIFMTVLSFIDEEHNVIEYKLEGFDEEWNLLNLSTLPTVHYNYLPPGEYKFRARAVNALGISSEYIVSAIIKIHLPFYREAWFIILVIVISLILLAMIILTANERIYRNKLEIEVESRTQLLTESERRYKMMFNENEAIMLLINPADGKIVEANPAAKRFYLINDEKINSLYYDDLIPQESIENYDILNYFKNQVYESVHIIDKKNIKNVLVHQSNIDTGSNKITYLIIHDIAQRVEAVGKLKALNAELENIIDANTKKLRESIDGLKNEINEHKHTEQKLNDAKRELEEMLLKEKQLGKLKSRFVSMISHEYRTPLTIVNTSAELIEESLKRDKLEDAKRFARKIERSVEVMTRLLEDVLLYDKIESNEYEGEISSVHLANMIENCRNKLSGMISIEHKINVNMEDPDLEIETDDYLLPLAIEKILNNAIKFSPVEKPITVDVSSSNGNVRIKITDRGKGISKNEIDNIFYPFFKGKNEIGISPGTGLGLALVKKALRILDGKIEVESKLYEGTTFTVQLPQK